MLNQSVSGTLTPQERTDSDYRNFKQGKKEEWTVRDIPQVCV